MIEIHPSSAPGRLGRRFIIGALLFAGLTLIGLFASAADVPEPSLLISELFLDPVGANVAQAVELFNAGPEELSVNGMVLASGNQASALRGLDDLPPGGRVVVRWNQTGASSGNIHFTGRTAELNPAQGHMALFRNDRVNDAAALLAYVQWGAANQQRANLAGQAGLWNPAIFIPRAPEGQSLALLPGGAGRAPGEWAASPSPSPGAVNGLPADGYRTWSFVGGPVHQAPALVFNPDLESLELVSALRGETLQHHRYLDEEWSLLDTPGDGRLPELVAAADGYVELLATGPDNQVLHNRFAFDFWDALTPTGGQSALPPAAAFNPTANTLELVIVVGDGRLRHSRFIDEQWSPFTLVGTAIGTAPVLVFNSQGSRLDLLFSGPDGVLQHSRFSGSAWSAPAATGGQTRLRPALIAQPDGALDAVIAATDGSVRHSRFVNGSWQTWQPLPGFRSDLPSSLVYNTRGMALELFVIGSDRQVRHARYTTAGWSLPVATGAVAAHPVSARLGARGLVEVVVAGQDGNLWHNRFQAPPPPGAISLARDVQPILTTGCAVSGCHRGSRPSEGLSLASGEFYDSTVGVASSQSDLSLIEPGASAESYLYHKIRGTQRTVGGRGSRMPLNRSALSAANIEKIRQWIDQGAEDN